MCPQRHNEVFRFISAFCVCFLAFPSLVICSRQQFFVSFFILVLACSKCKFFWLWNAPLVGNCSRIVLNLQFKVFHKKAGGYWREGGDRRKVLLSWPKLQVQREFCLLLSAYSGQLRVYCSCLPPTLSTMAISKSAFLKALANCPKSVKSFCMLAYSLNCK